MTITEVSDSLERVDNIINMLDEIMDHMDGFSSAEEAWLSSITETLRTWRYVMQETYESPTTREMARGRCLLGSNSRSGFNIGIPLRGPQPQSSASYLKGPDQFR
jgi:hypothetical protein